MYHILTYDPFISETLARSYGTLGRSSGAIHMICASLVDAVPVQGSAFIAQTIVDVDNHTITLHNINGWTWPVSS